MKQKHNGAKATKKKDDGAHNIDKVGADFQRLSISRKTKDAMFASLGRHALKPLVGTSARCLSSFRPPNPEHPFLDFIKGASKVVQEKVGPGNYEIDYHEAFDEELRRMGYKTESRPRRTQTSLSKEFQYSDQTIKEILTSGKVRNPRPPISMAGVKETCDIPDLVVTFRDSSVVILEFKAVEKLDCGAFEQILRYMQNLGYEKGLLINFGVEPPEMYEIKVNRTFFRPIFVEEKMKTISVRESAVNKYLNLTCVQKNVNGSMRKCVKLSCGEVVPPGHAPPRQRKDYKKSLLEPKAIPTKPQKAKKRGEQAPKSFKPAASSKSNNITTSSKPTAKGVATTKSNVGKKSNQSPGKVSTPKRPTQTAHRAQKTKFPAVNPSSQKTLPLKQPSKSLTKPSKKSNRPIGLTRRLDI